MNKDTLCADLQKLNDEEVQSFFIQDAITLIHEQQAEIEALKAQLEPDPNVCTYCGFFKGYCTCPTWNNKK